MTDTLAVFYNQFPSDHVNNTDISHVHLSIMVQ